METVELHHLKEAGGDLLFVVSMKACAALGIKCVTITDQATVLVLDLKFGHEFLRCMKNFCGFPTRELTFYTKKQTTLLQYNVCNWIAILLYI